MTIPPHINHVALRIRGDDGDVDRFGDEAGHGDDDAEGVGDDDGDGYGYGDMYGDVGGGSSYHYCRTKVV